MQFLFENSFCFFGDAFVRSIDRAICMKTNFSFKCQCCLCCERNSDRLTVYPPRAGVLASKRNSFSSLECFLVTIFYSMRPLHYQKLSCKVANMQIPFLLYFFIERKLLILNLRIPKFIRNLK